MDRVVGLLYLTVVSMLLLRHLWQFKFQNKLSFWLASLAFTAAFFNSLSFQFWLPGILGTESLALLNWASLHLLTGIVIVLMVLTLTSIPKIKQNHIVAKILVLEFFLGIAPGILPYQLIVMGINTSILLYFAFANRKTLGISFWPIMLGSSLLVMSLVLKIMGLPIILWQGMAVVLLLRFVDHSLIHVSGSD